MFRALSINIETLSYYPTADGINNESKAEGRQHGEPSLLDLISPDGAKSHRPHLPKTFDPKFQPSIRRDFVASRGSKSAIVFPDNGKHPQTV
jgi:hypothetical protein